MLVNAATVSSPKLWTLLGVKYLGDNKSSGLKRVSIDKILLIPHKKANKKEDKKCKKIVCFNISIVVVRKYYCKYEQ
jgi:hypothetical protein